MSKYKPDCPDLSKVPDRTTRTGLTSRQCVSFQEGVQKRIAENPEWKLARTLSNVRGKPFNRDSQLELEALGFEILGEFDELFYNVNPPVGWEKETEGYWTTIRDNQGKERMSQFFKGSSYDRGASLNIFEESK